MKNKITIISIIVAMFLVIFVAIGTSYSIWTTSVSQASTNTIDVGCFRITFTDINISGGGDISLTNSYPMTNEAGMRLLPYKFNIENQCSVAASYNVNLETLTTSSMDESKLNVYFNDSSIKSYIPNVVSGLTADAKNGMNLIRGYLPAGENVTYSLRVWIDYDVTADTPNIQGKTWNGRIAINSEATLSKPTFANKVVGEDNVTLDIDTRSSKTVSSLKCFYGDKNTQETRATEVGLTKCQYPLNAEYAKYTVTYTDGSGDISFVKKLADYYIKDGVELVPLSTRNTQITKNNGYMSADFGANPFNEFVYTMNKYDITKYKYVYLDFDSTFTLQNDGIYLPVIMVTSKNSQLISIRGFDVLSFTAGSNTIERKTIKALIDENNLYSNTGERLDSSSYVEDDYNDTRIIISAWSDDGNSLNSTLNIYNVYAQLVE